MYFDAISFITFSLSIRILIIYCLFSLVYPGKESRSVIISQKSLKASKMIENYKNKELDDSLKVCTDLVTTVFKMAYNTAIVEEHLTKVAKQKEHYGIEHFSSDCEKYFLCLRETVYKNQGSNKITDKYIRTIQSNEELQSKKEILNVKLKKCYNNLRWFRYIPKLNRKFTNIANELNQELRRLETLYKKPIIEIENIVGDIRMCSIRGLVYLDINASMSSKQLYVFYSFTMLKNKCKLYFKTSEKPIIALTFDFLEFLFYKDVTIVMTVFGFVVIDNCNIEVNFKKIQIVTNSDADINSFDILNQRWLHESKNGMPDKRYKLNPRVYVVEVGVLNLSIFNKNANFIFRCFTYHEMVGEIC